MAQHVERGRDWLKLQRDIGNDADHRDDGDQRAEAGGLAVARGDEVGDRGDTVGLADADDLADHEPPHQEYQCRTEVDRPKVDAAGGGAAHRSVESPGGAVDGDGEGIDPRAAVHAAPVVGTLVGKVGYGEEQSEHGTYDGPDTPDIQPNYP